MMSFNSMLRATPYHYLTAPRTSSGPEPTWGTDVAWLSSARLVRCPIKFGYERNAPERLVVFQQRSGGTVSSEEGGWKRHSPLGGRYVMASTWLRASVINGLKEHHVKSSWLSCSGREMSYSGNDNGKQSRKCEQHRKRCRGRDSRLQTSR